MNNKDYLLNAVLGLMVLALIACKGGNSGDGDIGLTCSISNEFTSQRIIQPQNLVEPSGIAYHPARNTIFSVGDEGDVIEMSLQGATLQSHRFGNLDLEGITVDPGTGLLYIVVEAASRIHEVDPANLVITRTFSLNWNLNGNEVLRLSNEAIESLVFVPDSTASHAGTFYMVNRSKQIDSNSKPSALYQFQLPVRDALAQPTGTLLSVWPLEISSVSGLCYDQINQSLLAVSDDRDAVFRLSFNGEVRGCYQVPGTQQEGITLTPAGSVYMADDREGVVYVFDE